MKRTANIGTWDFIFLKEIQCSFFNTLTKIACFHVSIYQIFRNSNGRKRALEKKRISSISVAYKLVGVIKHLQYHSGTFCTNDESSCCFLQSIPSALQRQDRVNNLFYNSSSLCMTESNTNSLVLSFVAEILYHAKCKKYVHQSCFKSTKVIFLNKEVLTWNIFQKYSIGFYSQVLFNILINIALRAFILIIMINFQSDFRLWDSSRKYPQNLSRYWEPDRNVSFRFLISSKHTLVLNKME